MPIKTPQAARELHTSYTRLMSLLRYGQIEPPAKDSSGDYVWTDADLAAARRVIESRHEREAVTR
jgi:hypothetical protein